MLRITVSNEASTDRTLRLEGKLLGPWVEELRRACFPSAEQVVARSLDLGAVSFVDAAGTRLLRELVQRGVMLARCSAFVAELLQMEKP
jgi:ABC-type transporter Mla MlaB component